MTLKAVTIPDELPIVATPPPPLHTPPGGVALRVVVVDGHNTAVPAIPGRSLTVTL